MKFYIEYYNINVYVLKKSLFKHSNPLAFILANVYPQKCLIVSYIAILINCGATFIC